MSCELQILVGAHMEGVHPFDTPRTASYMTDPSIKPLRRAISIPTQRSTPSPQPSTPTSALPVHIIPPVLHPPQSTITPPLQCRHAHYHHLSPNRRPIIDKQGALTFKRVVNVLFCLKNYEEKKMHQIDQIQDLQSGSNMRRIWDVERSIARLYLGCTLLTNFQHFFLCTPPAPPQFPSCILKPSSLFLHSTSVTRPIYRDLEASFNSLLLFSSSLSTYLHTIISLGPLEQIAALVRLQGGLSRLVLTKV